MKKLFIFAFAILFLGNVLASCGSGQININSASASELDTLYGIGPAKAQAIIDYREIQKFETVDDLINVSGIGPVTLSDIKSQGLACVESGNTNNAPTVPTENKTYVPVKTDTSNNEPMVIEPQTIMLNSNPSDTKAIKTGNVFGSSGDRAILGFVAFSVVILALFARKKRKYKNEFQDE